MRATDFITEIERLGKDDYTGGKSELQYVKKPGKKRVMPLPGGSGLQYAIIPETGQYYTIAIIDPNYTESEPVQGNYEWFDEFKDRYSRWQRSKGKAKPQVVGKLSVYGGDQGIPGALKVGAITVDEDYRGVGIAKALYGIVLTIMKKPLIAGSEQTPGGRKNWMSLASIPGVEVKGFVQLENDEVNFNRKEWPVGKQWDYTAKKAERDVDQIHDKLMQLGGQFLAKNKYNEYWAFDVMPGNGELKPAIKNSLSTLYSDYGSEPTGLIAYWTGQ